MHLRHVWATIILSLCIVPAFGQENAVIKGLEQARAIPSLTERIAYLRNLNPTVPIGTIKSTARDLAAKPTLTLPTAEQTTLKSNSFIQLPKRPRTGMEIYTHFSLRDKLSATKLFSAEELDLVEQAITNTDATFYRQTGENVSLLTQGWEAVEEPWNYWTRLQTELYNTFPQMSVQQRKIVTVQSGSFSFLRTYGQLLSLQNYVLYAGELPNPAHPLNVTARGKKRSTDPVSIEMYGLFDQYRINKTSSQWLKEYETNREAFFPGSLMYRVFQNRYLRIEKMKAAGKVITDEALLQMARIYLDNTERFKTPTEWLADYEKHPEDLIFGTEMYTAFRHKYKQVKAARAAEEEVDEASAQMAKIYEENTRRKKTPQSWLDEYEKTHTLIYGTPMYYAFEHKYREGKAAKAAGEKVDEASAKMAKIYEESTYRPTTTKEAYDIFLTYLRTNHAYPLSKTAVYPKVHARLRGKSLEDIQADSDLYKLYRLDQLARAVRRGEKPWEVFDRDNPLRRERIGERQEQAQGQESAEVLEEAYAQLPSDEQQVLRQTEEYYDQLWHNYPAWFEKNKGNIIFTWQTTTAFNILNKQVASGRANEEVTSTLDMLQQLSLGLAEDGTFNRVIYRGNTTTLTPRAEDFHLVIETQGLPSLPHIRQMFPQEVPHIYFKFIDGKISVMGLTGGVTVQDVETAIDTLLDHISQNAQVSSATDGWRIRMGKHEMSDRPHIHFEFVDGEEGVDLSYALRLDVRGVIPDEEIARQREFDRLFGKYIER